jgi:hypothetical protein
MERLTVKEFAKRYKCGSHLVHEVTYSGKLNYEISKFTGKTQGGLRWKKYIIIDEKVDSFLLDRKNKKRKKNKKRDSLPFWGRF